MALVSRRPRWTSPMARMSRARTMSRISNACSTQPGARTADYGSCNRTKQQRGPVDGVPDGAEEQIPRTTPPVPEGCQADRQGARGPVGAEEGRLEPDPGGRCGRRPASVRCALCVGPAHWGGPGGLGVLLGAEPQLKHAGLRRRGGSQGADGSSTSGGFHDGRARQPWCSGAKSDPHC